MKKVRNALKAREWAEARTHEEGDEYKGADHAWRRGGRRREEVDKEVRKKTDGSNSPHAPEIPEMRRILVPENPSCL